MQVGRQRRLLSSQGDDVTGSRTTSRRLQVECLACKLGLVTVGLSSPQGDCADHHGGRDNNGGSVRSALLHLGAAQYVRPRRYPGVSAPPTQGRLCQIDSIQCYRELSFWNLLPSPWRPPARWTIEDRVPELATATAKVHFLFFSYKVVGQPAIYILFILCFQERTFLYVLYVQSVQLIAESSYPETAVVCRWYVDSADDCSGQFTVASGVEPCATRRGGTAVKGKCQWLRLAKVNRILVAEELEDDKEDEDKAERSKDLTMTLTADSTHICYACLNLEHYPCEDTVLPAQLPLQTQHGDSVVTLAYANVLFARQPRYWSDIPPALSVEGFFVPPLTGDSQ
ncbi:unnamed protein product, partial [Prorocentrum cordatum]